MGYQVRAWVGKQGGCISMAQSKKDLLKKMRRECRHLVPQLHRHAAQTPASGLLDEFDLLWCDATGMLWELQHGYPGILERPAGVLPPVTSQQVAELYERWQTFAQAVLAAL
jgi:hypothetical protein